MLLLLYSDTNYVMSGFLASYSVSPCPNQCSLHGQCEADTGQCQCHPGYSGNDCSLALCPGSCGTDKRWGNCKVTNSGDYKCQCNSGFIGDDCSLNERVSITYMNNEVIIFFF